MRQLTLAISQFPSIPGDIRGNLDKMLDKMAYAASKNADYVIFSELSLTGYNCEMMDPELDKVAFSLDDWPLQELETAARKHHISAFVGFIERRVVPGVYYNSVAFINAADQSISSYAKVHLFTKEKLFFKDGESFDVCTTPHGRFGMLICMDIGFPEAARIECLAGAELLIAPSAWIEQDRDLWELHLRSRALDNLVFVAGCNHSGSEGDLNYIGESMIVDPRGHVLSCLDEKEDMLISTIDLDEVASARRRAFHWSTRKPHMYSDISKPM